MTMLLVCIADDSSGATDLANTLIQRGMRAVQTIGVPAAHNGIGDAEAVVVALKSRTSIRFPAENISSLVISGLF